MAEKYLGLTVRVKLISNVTAEGVVREVDTSVPSILLENGTFHLI